MLERSEINFSVPVKYYCAILGVICVISLRVVVFLLIKILHNKKLEREFLIKPAVNIRLLRFSTGDNYRTNYQHLLENLILINAQTSKILFNVATTPTKTFHRHLHMKILIKCLIKSFSSRPKAQNYYIKR